jgi:hypothetical protein
MDLLGDPAAAVQARATAMSALGRIESMAKKSAARGDAEWRAHHAFTAARIAAGLSDPALYEMRPARIPPGSPI